jgi:DNA ligase-1
LRTYALLLDALSYTQGRNRKISLLKAYFQSQRDDDRGWALASLTDGLPVRVSLRRILSDITSALIDPVLYKLSRDYVGDTAETVALLWPRAREQALDPSLSEIVTAMQFKSSAGQAEALTRYLDGLDVTGRWALLKLLGGAARVGVSARLARLALAEAFGRDVSEIEEIWYALEPPYRDLFAWLEGSGPKPETHHKPVFRPVMLAHPIEAEDWPGLNPEDFLAEWKWDGIRIQLAARGGLVRIFSRQGDDISAAFPEIADAFRLQNCVADGELLVMRDGVVAPFNDLQQRLNRKAPDAKLVKNYPAFVRLYDLLFDGVEDLRALPFLARRKRLEDWHRRHRPALSDISELVSFEDIPALEKLWQATRDDGVEGLMLKRKDSAYLAGRIKGQWFKWKRAPLTLDCVLMYAQRGSGKRSSFYSDYTFGTWRDKPDAGRELVPVGKAYSGFTDEELKRLDRWIRAHTTESFGPVRAVEPALVLEVAFDSVHTSSRHKSGVAMRFPRIHRIRWDKPADEADTLATVQSLITG